MNRFKREKQNTNERNQIGISFNVDLQIEFIILKFDKNSFKMGPSDVF